MPDILFKIVVNEQQREKHGAACRKIMNWLLEQGVPGATMRRGEAGLNERDDLSFDLLEDTYFNDLPVVIESVMDQTQAEKIEGELRQMMEHGQICKTENRRENLTGGHSHFAVKVYTRESSKLMKQDEYEKILRLLQRHKAIWATVTKAIAGYGRDGVIYGRHVFSPSEHLPLIIECVVERDRLPLLLDELKAVVTEGAVFTAPVDLVLNR